MAPLASTQALAAAVAPLMTPKYKGGVDIDGMLIVNRTDASTNLTEWDFTARFYNNLNSEFTIDTRSEAHPWWSLENQEGWIYFTFENDRDFWITRDIWYNPRSLATVHANVESDYLDVIDGGEGAYRIYASGGDIYGHYTNGSPALLFTQQGNINIFLGRINDAESARIAALGGGTGGGGSSGVDADSLPLAWATNIVIAGGTNLAAQRIVSVTGPCTITMPAKADTNDFSSFTLLIPAPTAATNTVSILTNSPAVIGYCPTIPTNAASMLYGYSAPNSSSWRLRRQF